MPEKRYNTKANRNYTSSRDDDAVGGCRSCSEWDYHRCASLGVKVASCGRCDLYRKAAQVVYCDGKNTS